jgi:hypothetical protein
MVNQLVDDAKAAAEQMKADAEAQIRLWMAELPELPELPKIPMSIELMALVSKLGGYASDLADGNIPEDLKKEINKKIAAAKKEFKESWGEGLDKAGVDLDAILSALDGGDIDPCAIIPNLQKGVDGAIELLPNMPKFPIDGALGELKSEISEAATVAKGKLTEFGADVDAGVGAIAKQVKDATDDASIKLERMGTAPASRRAPMEKPNLPVWTISANEAYNKAENAIKKETYDTALALWEKQQPLITK